MTAENWLDFYKDIKSTRFEYLARLSRRDVKFKLMGRPVADSLEMILSKERMAILTLYYERSPGLETVKNDSILNSFRRAITEKNINRARLIQKEIYERISDSKLPDDFLDKLEIPREKTYWELLNDRVIYKYSLNVLGAYDALDAFREIHDLDPDNGKINYNICALSLFAWQFQLDSIDINKLLSNINQLGKQGIHPSLVRRILVNYHILQSFYLLNKYKYDEKDSSVLFIKENYARLALTDEDRFSLAKYFSFYSQEEWGEELIEDRIDKLDVSEDLLFYYVNLGFFKPDNYENEKFKKALLNASIINRERFCRFFNSINKGGVSIQLLEEALFRQLYCENCVSSQRI